jgi:hypothetical protein
MMQLKFYHFCLQTLINFLLDLFAGGSCWTMVNHSGRCMERLAEKITREECCSYPGMTHLVAYATEEMDPGTIFFWRALGGGVPCSACKGRYVGCSFSLIKLEAIHGSDKCQEIINNLKYV